MIDKRDLKPSIQKRLYLCPLIAIVGFILSPIILLKYMILENLDDIKDFYSDVYDLFLMRIKDD